VKYANVENLSKYYPPNSFDLLTCLHVLEHCRHPYKVLKELKKVTKKYILIAVPNARYIIQEEREAHLYSWNESSLRNLLKDLEFKIIILSEEWVNVIPNVLRMAPIINRVLLKLFYKPMELIALIKNNFN